jgi:hypothetical protein
MPERIIRGVNNDLRVVMRIRSAVACDQIRGRVVFGRPWPHIQARHDDRAEDGSNPGVVAQEGAPLANEDGAQRGHFSCGYCLTNSRRDVLISQN